MMRFIMLAMLLSACANSPASQLFNAAEPSPAPDTTSAEAAYYLGMYDMCYLFGAAHFEAQLPDAAIEAEIDTQCMELVQAGTAADMWGEHK